ncbi:hypothetical protein CKY47_31335 [Saccharothrix yanglingensis]|uniref:Uncharacterized protein n=1 Tax=Saccharothrix yanglingensis TaxID=659496 RepID=A0ABU0X8D1_9PSEU|nr:hypothetical protein [Saccharothrix yanglingensis]
MARTLGSIGCLQDSLARKHAAVHRTEDGVLRMLTLPPVQHSAVLPEWFRRRGTRPDVMAADNDAAAATEQDVPDGCRRSA